MQKEKKQFRLYDVYRYAATGEQSNIQGIRSYECNTTATTLVVRFTDYGGSVDKPLACNYFPRNERELKRVISEVNKRLGNCMKPGRRR